MSTTLDTISRELKTDCCWIQLLNNGSDQLPLTASLGFSSDMKRGMSAMERDHLFAHEIVGIGHNVVIPNLNQDGKYAIPSFAESGYKSLLAVPIMTYRVHGILGIGYRSRKRLPEEFCKLITVIANLLGMALHKSNLNKQSLQKDPPEKPSPVTNTPARTLKEPEVETESIAKEPDIQPILPDEKKELRNGFSDHTRRMKRFSESHE